MCLQHVVSILEDKAAASILITFAQEQGIKAKKEQVLPFLGHTIEVNNNNHHILYSHVIGQNSVICKSCQS